MTRACAGVVFQTVEVAWRFMAGTLTATGLFVTVYVLDRLQETRVKVAADFKRTMRIAYDEHRPKWNCRAIPTNMWKPETWSGIAPNHS